MSLVNMMISFPAPAAPASASSAFFSSPSTSMSAAPPSATAAPCADSDSSHCRRTAYSTLSSTVNGFTLKWCESIAHCSAAPAAIPSSAFIVSDRPKLWEARSRPSSVATAFLSAGMRKQPPTASTAKNCAGFIPDDSRHLRMTARHRCKGSASSST